MQPSYPQIILSFVYRGCKVQIDRDEADGSCSYAAWVRFPAVKRQGLPDRWLITMEAVRWLSLVLLLPKMQFSELNAGLIASINLLR